MVPRATRPTEGQSRCRLKIAAVGVVCALSVVLMISSGSQDTGKHRALPVLQTKSMEEYALTMMKAGDVVLARTGSQGHLITLVGKHIAGHVGIVIQNPYYDYAGDDTYLRKLIGWDRVIMHATDQGVIFNLPTSSLFNSDRNKKVWVRRIDSELDTTLVEEFRKHWDSAKYRSDRGLKGILNRIGLKTFCGIDIKPGNDVSDGVICSELVARLVEWCGVMWFNVIPASVLPKDFAKPRKANYTDLIEITGRSVEEMKAINASMKSKVDREKTRIAAENKAAITAANISQNTMKLAYNNRATVTKPYVMGKANGRVVLDVGTVVTGFRESMSTRTMRFFAMGHNTIREGQDVETKGSPRLRGIATKNKYMTDAWDVQFFTRPGKPGPVNPVQTFHSQNLRPLYRLTGPEWEKFRQHLPNKTEWSTER